jgi:uroporphyrinogen-III decarboxylase
VAQTGGRGHIVAAGCVVPVDVSEERLQAARQAVEAPAA